MMRSHPDGTQECMGENLNLAIHGQGDHHHVRDIGEKGVHQEGATGVTRSPQSSTSPTRSQTTPPGRH